MADEKSPESPQGYACLIITFLIGLSVFGSVAIYHFYGKGFVFAFLATICLWEYIDTTRCLRRWLAKQTLGDLLTPAETTPTDHESGLGDIVTALNEQAALTREGQRLLRERFAIDDERKRYVLSTREPWHIDDTSEQRGQSHSRTFINVQDLFERAEEFEIATLNWVRIILRDSTKERTLTGSQAKGFIDWVRFHAELIPDEMYAALKREAVPVEVAPPKPKIWTCTACGADVETESPNFRWTGVWQHRCGMEGTVDEWANCYVDIAHNMMERARAAMSNVPTEAIDSLVDELKKRGGE